MKLSIVMPVYNEINTLLEILRQVQAVPLEKEIIIVDDFSTDGTREILNNIHDSNVRVFLNDKNMGKGFAIRKGFEQVTGDIVIIQDADLEYYPDEYPILIQKILEGKADVVFGTRFLGSRRVYHFYHYVGNTILNLLANILYNANLTDLMTCYKAFRTDMLKRLTLKANGFGIESEITGQIFKRKYRVYEVPISYNGRDYDEGKKITWKDFFRSLYWLIRCKFTSYDIGEDTLYRMKLMKNNNKYLFKQIDPYLGNNVLEIGSGVGNISKFLTGPRRKLYLTDINDTYLDNLKQRFIGNPHVEIFNQDMSSPDISRLSSLGLDTVVFVNVLEHIKDDDTALGNVNKILVQNGYMILMVPALNKLYGSLDENLDHFRRYEKNELAKQVEKHGFEIEKIYYHNFLATLGWYVNGRIFKRKIMSSFQVALFDKIMPLIAMIENRFTLPFGLSLFVICKKK